MHRLWLYTLVTLGGLALSACGGSSAGSSHDAATGTDVVGGGHEVVSFQDGAVTFDPPEGAVPDGVEFTVSAAEDYPDDELLVPGTVWEFGPDGLRFAEPVDVLVRFDPSLIPQGYPPELLRLHKVVDGAWQQVPGSGVYLDTNQVIAPLEGFSIYGVIAVSGTAQARPVINELTPASGKPGDRVFLRGMAFAQTTPTRLIFGHPDNEAELIDVYDSGITAVVPDGIPATPSPREVQVYVLCGAAQSASVRYTLVREASQEAVELLALDPDHAPVGGSVTVTVRHPGPYATSHRVTFGGAAATPTTYEPVTGEDDTVRMDVQVPSDALSGDVVVVRETDGSTSGALSFTLEVPDAPTLRSPADAAPLFDPWFVFDEGYDTEESIYVEHSLVLRGNGLMSFRNPLCNTTNPGADGTLDVWVTTPNGQARLMGFALSDTTLAVPVQAAAEFYGGRGEPAPLREMLRGLRRGDEVTVHVCGVPIGGGPEVCSEEAPLAVAEPPVYGGTTGFFVGEDEFGEWSMRVALGDLLCFGSITSEIGVGNVLTAPDLWEGSLTFGNYGTGWYDHLLEGRCLRMDTQGDFVVTNETAGLEMTVHVEPAGTYDWISVGTSETSFPRPRHLPETGAVLGGGGMRVTIPPGALPAHDGIQSVRLQHNHSPDTSNFDTQQSDADHVFLVEFDPEPSILHQPITIDLPFDPDGQEEPPEFAFFDTDSGLYWTLEAEIDEAAGRARFVLPAGTYGGDVSKAAPATQNVIQTANLNRITRHLSCITTSWDGSRIEDPQGRIVVDYVIGAGSPHQVSDAYAEQVLETSLLAYEILEAYGWDTPTWKQWVYIRHLDDWQVGGSTNRCLFGYGEPYVYINAQSALGSRKLLSSCAHEMGHVFQRVRTTTQTTKWIDEATAEWVAHTTVGADFFAYDMGHAIPWLNTLPSGFWAGMDTEQAYASGALAIWMAQEYGVDVIDDLYELFETATTWWYDSYGAFKEVTGDSIDEMYDKFAQAFWTQNYLPLDTVDLDFPLTAAEGPLLPNFAKEMSSWAGALVTENSRPALSSARYRVTPTASFRGEALGRPVVARLMDGSSNTKAYVYGDPTCATPVTGLVELTELSTLFPRDVVGSVGDYACYRVVLINRSSSAAELISALLAVPHITSVAPNHGPAAGGSTVTVSGSAFGFVQGTLYAGPFPLPLQSWSDTSITAITIPDVAGNSVDITVETAEGAVTNAVTFTYDP